jgi:hypothetical protein
MIYDIEKNTIDSGNENVETDPEPFKKPQNNKKNKVDDTDHGGCKQC